MKSLDMGTILSEVRNDFAREQRMKKKLGKLAIAGKVPMVIYSKSADGKMFGAVPWAKSSLGGTVWEHPEDNLFCIYSRAFKKEALRFDFSGEVAEKLEEFRKARVKLNRQEQTFLRQRFRHCSEGDKDYPPLKGVSE